MASKRKRHDDNINTISDDDHDVESKPRKHKHKHSKKSHHKSTAQDTLTPPTLDNIKPASNVDTPSRIKHVSSNTKSSLKDDNNDDKSAFFMKTMQCSVSLLPSNLQSIQQSVKETLRELLLQYVNGVGGVVLAITNVKVGKHGKILNAFPYVHHIVHCDVLVFAPQHGTVLRGKITQESSYHSHLALVVNGYFNASISANDMRQAGYTFDDTLEEWYNTDQTLSVESTVEFHVDKVHHCSGIISIEASQPKLVVH